MITAFCMKIRFQGYACEQTNATGAAPYCLARKKRVYGFLYNLLPHPQATIRIRTSVQKRLLRLPASH